MLGIALCVPGSRILWLVLWLGACASPSPTEVTLQLTLDEGCTPDDLAAVSLLSIEVYGSDAEGRPCALARRCVTVEQVTGVTTLVEALQRARQPLVDIEDRGAELVVVTGHATIDCFAHDDRTLCGLADLREVEGGVLSIPLACGDCSDEEYPLCP